MAALVRMLAVLTSHTFGLRLQLYEQDEHIALRCLFMGAAHAPASMQGVCGSGRHACFLSIEVTSAPAFTRYVEVVAVPLHVLMGRKWFFSQVLL